MEESVQNDIVESANIEPANMETQPVSQPEAEVVPQPAPTPQEPEKKKKKATKKKKGCCIAIAVILVLLAILGVLAATMGIPLIQKLANVYEPFEVTDEKLEELAPIDPDEAAALDAMEGYDAEDSWVIYVYLVGADLESRGMNNLSPITDLRIAEEAESVSAKGSETTLNNIKEFLADLDAQGADLPNIFYETYARTDAEGTSITEDDPTVKGFASADFMQMTSVELPANVKLVIQTGGAKRWQFNMINPNLTQRFLVDDKGIHEIWSTPAINVSTPAAVTDFLKYGIENYPADHSMVLFWNHGGGFTGYGLDEIYGSMLSLNDLHQALEDAVGYDPENPYFEAIGFDACLMASAEAVHQLYGFSKYLYASEETEPGTGWDHEYWLKSLAEHPEMNGAQLGRAITDGYVNASNGAYADLGYVGAGTFAVIEMNEAEKAWEAYTNFAKSALKAVLKNPAKLAEISRAANGSLFYAGTYYRVYNTIDLGLFMDNISEAFPAEASAVKDHLQKAILYHRGSGYLMESQGLTVYYPAHIEGVGGLNMFLKYVNQVSDNQDINALYYYKVAGCLNDSLQEYVAEQGYDEAKLLDYSRLNAVSTSDIQMGENGVFSFAISDEMVGLVQDASLFIAAYDEESDIVTYYGESPVMTDRENSSIVATFSGKWLLLNDAPLPLEIIGNTGENTTFTAKMQYNALMDIEFMLSYNDETGEVDFLGIRDEMSEANQLGRQLLPIKEGGLYAPVYETSNLNDGSVGSSTGSAITFNKDNTSIALRDLPDGTYLAYVVVEDVRSGKYYSPVIRYVIQDGQVAEQAVADEFFAYDNQK